MDTTAEANRKGFNEFSAEYDSKPWQHQLRAQVRQALQDRIDWIGLSPLRSPSDKSLKLLDYACGTGAITKALGPYVGSIKGVDISEKMVERYNDAVSTSGLTKQQACAVVGDLCAEEGVPQAFQDNPEFFNFDIAAIGLGFHHFDSPALAVQRLAERLKAGSGLLLIIDFLPFQRTEPRPGRDSNGDGPHRLAHTVKTTGFTEADVKELYENAGMGGDFGFDALTEPVILGEGESAQTRQLFIAKGRRLAN